MSSKTLKPLERIRELDLFSELNMKTLNFKDEELQ
jgi:hypothetical protein